MNTPLELKPLRCPRPGCGRSLEVLANGGTIYFRCQQDEPKCGILLPAQTALAWYSEQRIAERQKTKEVVRDIQDRKQSGEMTT